MFRLKVVTPTSTFYDEVSEMAIFRTTVGDRAILTGHIPMVAGIKEGKLKVKKDGKFREANIGNGFVTVDSNTETVIVTEKAIWENE